MKTIRETRGVDEPVRLEKSDLQAIFDRSPFLRFMSLEVLEVDHEASRLAVRMPIRPEFERGKPGSGQFHGGSVASMIDVVGDFAVGMQLGGGVPTMNLRIDYLRPAVGAYLDGAASVRRMGRSAAVVDIDVTDPAGKLVAVGRGTYVPQRG